MKWFRGLRTQKSMIMWAKRQYHECFKDYKLTQRCFTTDGAAIAASIARVQTWEEVLYYLTGDEEWRE